MRKLTRSDGFYIERSGQRVDQDRSVKGKFCKSGETSYRWITGKEFYFSVVEKTTVLAGSSFSSQRIVVEFCGRSQGIHDGRRACFNQTGEGARKPRFIPRQLAGQVRNQGVVCLSTATLDAP